MREKAYARHYFIVDYLRQQKVGRRLDQIHRAVADEFETCERTIRRDLQTLRHAGFPVSEEKSAAGTLYKYVGPTWSSAPLSLDPLQAAGLVLARKALSASGEVFFAAQLDQLLEQLSRFQTDAFRKSLQKLEKSVYCQAPTESRQSYCERIIQGIDKRLMLRIDYRNSRGETTVGLKIAPVQFWISASETYLVAYCYTREEIRFFALKRVLSLDLLDEHFEPHWTFDAGEIARESIGTVHARPELIEIEFDDMLTEYFNTHPIHASQKMLRRNGTAMLQLKVGINESLIHQLLGFGPRITITKPQRLRKLILRRLANTMERYSTDMADPVSILPLAFA